jgi:SPP1 gp7 family putative phage head morphogenesis protein
MDEGMLEKIINRIIRLIHQGQLRGNAPADLSLIVANTLHEALTVTFKMDTVEHDQPENVAAANMRRSIFAFAAAKSYSAIKAMTDRLFDEEGNIKRFSEFKREALEVHETYNVDWLKSEYNHAVGSIQMANRWLDYERQAEALPYLTYNTAGDDRVRQSHAILDGATLPVDHKFWETNYPPNGWGCRCDVSQTNDESLLTSDETAERLDKEVEKESMFNLNTGKTGEVFKNNHPYFSDVDGNIEELRAERDYGMRGLDSILADRNKLPAQQEPVKAIDSWWSALQTRRGFGSDQVSLKDKNANAILLKKGTITDKAIAANVERVLTSPSEIWAQEAATVYLKFHKDSVMMVKVDKDLVLSTATKSTIKRATNAYSKERTGILIHR